MNSDLNSVLLCLTLAVSFPTSETINNNQEKLRAKALKMDNVMQIVIKAVNFIKSKGLNHHQFEEFIRSMNNHYLVIIYFSEGRWLSWGKMLNRCYSSWNEIKAFMESKGKLVPEIEDEKWLTDLAFLVDLTAHLNELNMHIQGENHLFCAMFQTISAFEMKLTLWQAQVRANNCMPCATLSKHSSCEQHKMCSHVFRFYT